MFRSLTRYLVRRPIPARAALRLESLERRDTPSWGGIPPLSVVPSGALGVALNAQHAATGNAAVTANEVDYYTLIAPVSGTYRFSATTPASSLDTVLGVFSAAGSRLAFNDDIASTNYDSTVAITLVAGQRYYFGITNYLGSAGGTYSWQVAGPGVSTPVDDAYEDNDNLAAATNLGTLTTTRTVSGLVLADAGDYFRFTTAATGAASNSVSISFANSQGNLALALYNSAGTLIRYSDTLNNGESVSLSGLGTGTYIARVYGAANPAYTLTITAPTPSTAAATASFNITLRMTGLTASQQAIFARAAARWEQVIVGDLPAATYNGVAVDDLLIDASARTIDGAGGVLGSAGPDSLRSTSRLPYHGTMSFDSADLAALEASGQLYYVVLHEMGHVLGIGTMWSSFGLLAGAGTANPVFVGAHAAAEYDALFHTTAAGVPVEGNNSPVGSRDTHWRESVFGSELMTPYVNAGTLPISRVTIASLWDMGYVVNMAAADLFVG